MNGKIINDLPNEEYHHGVEYSKYISSTQLKDYLISPAYARYKRDNPEDPTEAMMEGSALHTLLECYAKYGSLERAKSMIVGYNPPINPRTGQSYTPASKAYQAALEAFKEFHAGKLIVSTEMLQNVYMMVDSLMRTEYIGQQVLKLLKWGTPEVSMILEEGEFPPMKIRCDLLTKNKIVDWKTTSSMKLDSDSINSIIYQYGYDISAAMYQYVAHAITGQWMDYYLVFIGKNAPWDCMMVDMRNYGYHQYGENDEDVMKGGGAIRFEKLMQIHRECLENEEWPGASYNVEAVDGIKILEIEPPAYYVNKVANMQ